MIFFLIKIIFETKYFICFTPIFYVETVYFISHHIIIFYFAPNIPHDIAEDLYGEFRRLKASTNKEEFDAAYGNMIHIIVSYDMGWSKRGTGRSYDSLN